MGGTTKKTSANARKNVVRKAWILIIMCVRLGFECLDPDKEDDHHPVCVCLIIELGLLEAAGAKDREGGKGGGGGGGKVARDEMCTGMAVWQMNLIGAQHLKLISRQCCVGGVDQFITMTCPPSK